MVHHGHGRRQNHHTSNHARIRGGRLLWYYVRCFCSERTRMDFRCPRCQTIVYLDPASTDVPVRCGACNAVFIPQSYSGAGGKDAGDIIDIHAEPVSGTYEPPEEPASAGKRRPDIGEEPSWTLGGPSGRYVVIEKHVPLRDAPDFGCCGCGCMLLLLLFLLYMAGCASLVMM